MVKGVVTSVHCAGSLKKGVGRTREAMGRPPTRTKKYNGKQPSVKRRT
jgi:hypothetical protein